MRIARLHGHITAHDYLEKLCNNGFHSNHTEAAQCHVIGLGTLCGPRRGIAALQEDFGT
jgi:hypothetical protein